MVGDWNLGARRKLRAGVSGTRKGTAAVLLGVGIARRAVAGWPKVAGKAGKTETGGYKGQIAEQGWRNALKNDRKPERTSMH